MLRAAIDDPQRARDDAVPSIMHRECRPDAPLARPQSRRRHAANLHPFVRDERDLAPELDRKRLLKICRRGHKFTPSFAKRDGPAPVTAGRTMPERKSTIEARNLINVNCGGLTSVGFTTTVAGAFLTGRSLCGWGVVLAAGGLS